MISGNAVQYVIDAAARNPQRPALWVEGDTYSYAQLMTHAYRLARQLRGIEGPVCATLGERSLTAYCAPLACMLAGKIHVPLGASFPETRMLDVLERTAPAGLIVDEANVEAAHALVAKLMIPPVVLLPARWHESRNRLEDTVEADALEPLTGAGHRTGIDNVSGLPVGDSEIAYVLFTSGSTGRPKGVAVGHEALRAYIATVLARYPQLDARQRCTQFFEPTFDLSMHDMFVTWAAGACLYSVPKAALLMPTDFVNAHQLTVWFSVPSLAATLQRYRLLVEGVFPSIKLALFCGEALPAQLADAWQAAAPNARCENIYGPTEATIACTGYPFGIGDADHAVVPIGTAFSGMEIAVVDALGTPCDADADGELWLGGSQLAIGYWQDAAQTADRFVSTTLPGYAATRWYRTGDLARIDASGTAHYRGRLDRQIKLRGYRIELQEIESHLREACARGGAPAEVAVIAMVDAPNGSATGLAAFVVQTGHEARLLLSEMKRRVPAYMVPDRIHMVDALPLNSNGKIDYPALTAHARRASPATRRGERSRKSATAETSP